MKERPILFSAPMVRAILEGRKTQTRRTVRDAPDAPDYRPVPIQSPWWTFSPTSDYGESHDVKCPYGAAGDRLWVRESIKLVARRDEENGPDTDVAVYAADEQVTLLDTWPWQREVLPGIHMPYGLRRITLEVTGIRVERLHAITEEDARAEGVWYPNSAGHCWPDGTARRAFLDVWRTINGVVSLRSNPWVWVVGFRRADELPSTLPQPSTLSPVR